MSYWHWRRGLGNTALRSDWASAEDGPVWQPHIRSKEARRKLSLPVAREVINQPALAVANRSHIRVTLSLSN